jgi:aspartyl-tRNA(Asn)/glutamyl-tRNA(Gln) amidotransferase subunit A
MAETITAATQSVLANCEERNPDLFAFSAIPKETALATATYLDAMKDGGVDLGPLHGVPICVKDIIDVSGMPTHAGSATRPSPEPATKDAFVVSKLRAAGTVIVAKSNTVEFAFGGWGTNKNIGTPKNPWNTDVHHTPGGSSSGTGVAVGSGLMPAGLGTDTGGSVRIPAAFCGCVGLKTSIGLVSRAGVVPLSDTFDTVGPLTDTVRRAAQMLDVMQGEDRDDPTTVGISRKDPMRDLERGVSGLRIAVLQPDDLPRMTRDVGDAYARAQGMLGQLGASLSPMSLPLEFLDYQTRATRIVSSDAYAFHSDIADDPNAPMNDTTRMRMHVGKDLSAKDRVLAQRERQQAIADFLARFDRYDALVIPSAPITAVPLTEADENNYEMSLYTRPANYLELCGLSVPIGIASNGMPTSLQIVTRRFDDPLALRIGYAFEDARGAIA